LPEHIAREAGGACRRGDLRPAGLRHPLARTQLVQCRSDAAAPPPARSRERRPV